MSDYSVEACDTSVGSEAKDPELVSQMAVGLRESFPQGLKLAFSAGLVGMAEELAEKLALVTSGAKRR